MFEVRRYRSARRAIQRNLAVVLIVCGVSTTLVTPAEADGKNANAGEGKVSGVAFNLGGPGPGQGSGCKVVGYDGKGRYFVTAITRDGEQRVSEGVLDRGEEDVLGDSTYDSDRDDATVDPQLIDPNEDGPSETGFDYDSFSAELEDGKFDVDGVAWGVWRVYCGEDRSLETGDYNLVSAPLSPAGLILPALDFVEEYLPEPELTLQPFDEEYDWTYVQAPIDFRTPSDTLLPITITADTGGPEQIRQWITITATPNMVIFDSGDPRAEVSRTVCPAEAADDPYVAETPGLCSYTYRNGSSIVDGNVFDAELSITWTVTYLDSDGGTGTLTVAPTTQQEDVAVAEVKAVNVYDR